MSAAATKQAIAEAAQELFSTHEYADASVRAIAARAGVDPALVIRYFTSKENLFLETVGFTGHFGEAMAGPTDGLGVRIVGALLSAEAAKGFAAYRALMRASGSAPVRARLLEAIDAQFVAPLIPRLEGPDAPLRARLVAAQLAGLVDGIAILGDTELIAVDRTTLARVYGAAIQVLLDEPS